MKADDLTHKHTKITFVLLDSLDNLALNDDVIWEMVHERFGGSRSGKSYRTGKAWANDMSWNRRYIYTMLGFLECKNRMGLPTNTDAEKAIAAAYAGSPAARGLAGLIFGAIGQPLTVPHELRGSGSNFEEGRKWADVYAVELSKRKSDDLERIRRDIVRRPNRDLEIADKLLAQLWPNVPDP